MNSVLNCLDLICELICEFLVKNAVLRANKTGLQPVSRLVERVYYLGGGVGVQSSFEAIAVQTVKLLAMHISV